METISLKIVELKTYSSDDEHRLETYVIICEPQNYQMTSIKSGKNPTWNETFDINFPRFSLVVWENNKFLGFVDIDTKCLNVSSCTVSYRLDSRYWKNESCSGEILISCATTTNLIKHRSNRRFKVSFANVFKSRIPTDFEKITDLDLSCFFTLELIPSQVLNHTWDSLDLSFNQFLKWPNYLHYFKKLNSLYLCYSHLNSIPDEIERLVTLKTLYVCENSIYNITSKIINLKHLEYFNLKNNQISFLPPEIGELVSLRTLIISDNLLKSLPTTIGKLSNLKTIIASRCSLKSLPDEICELENINELDFETNQLNKLPEDIGKLTNLISLNIMDNMVRSLPLSLCECINLNLIKIERNPLQNDKLWNAYSLGPKKLLEFLAEKKSTMKIKDTENEKKNTLIDPQIILKKKIAIYKKIQIVQRHLVQVKKSIFLSSSIEECLLWLKMIDDIKSIMDNIKLDSSNIKEPKDILIFNCDSKLLRLKKSVMFNFKKVEYFLAFIKSSEFDPDLIGEITDFLLKTTKLVVECKKKMGLHKPDDLVSKTRDLNI